MIGSGWRVKSKESYNMNWLGWNKKKLKQNNKIA